MYFKSEYVTVREQKIVLQCKSNESIMSQARLEVRNEHQSEVASLFFLFFCEQIKELN